MPNLQLRKEASEVLLARALDSLDVLIARGNKDLVKSRKEIETHLDDLLQLRMLEASIAFVSNEEEAVV